MWLLYCLISVNCLLSHSYRFFTFSLFTGWSCRPQHHPWEQPDRFQLLRQSLPAAVRPVEWHAGTRVVPQDEGRSELSADRPGDHTRGLRCSDRRGISHRICGKVQVGVFTRWSKLVVVPRSRRGQGEQIISMLFFDWNWVRSFVRSLTFACLYVLTAWAGVILSTALHLNTSFPFQIDCPLFCLFVCLFVCLQCFFLCYNIVFFLSVACSLVSVFASFHLLVLWPAIRVEIYVTKWLPSRFQVLNRLLWRTHVSIWPGARAATVEKEQRFVSFVYIAGIREKGTVSHTFWPEL